MDINKSAKRKDRWKCIIGELHRLPGYTTHAQFIPERVEQSLVILQLTTASTPLPLKSPLVPWVLLARPLL
ncbi:hypothetical protein J6590_038815 [Homalodisca vitripennis]|nr:hypothetical protein J6590_038815 [Homalodisca vitripennis]